MTRAEDAQDLFNSGKYNCAQAILAAYGPSYGIERGLALRVSSVFGTGIARTGGMCGSVSGALMVLSLRYCTGEPKGLLPKPVHRKARTFIKRFEAETGSTNCNAMRGKDAMRGKYVKGNNESCPGFVELACRILDDML